MSFEDHQEMEILFWAKKFKQHFHFIGIFIVQNAEKLEQLAETEAKAEAQTESKAELQGVLSPLPKQLFTVDQLLAEALLFERKWERISQSREPSEEIAERPGLIKKSFRFKKHMETIFKNAGIPCAPALFHHMQEELIYFEQAILRGQWSYAQEMAWWAQEHAENLDFVICELPRLIVFKKINLMEIPSMVKMFVDNKKLSNKFKAIEKKIKELNAALPSDTEGGEDKEVVTSQLYHEMMSAKISHLHGIGSLMEKIDKLPISEEDKFVVAQLLEHEREDAQFSFHRLRHPGDFL